MESLILWITENEVNRIIQYRKCTIHNEGSSDVTVDGLLLLKKGDKYKLGKSETLITKRLCIIFSEGEKKVLITYQQ
jgi:hypothetical protein